MAASFSTLTNRCDVRYWHGHGLVHCPLSGVKRTITSTVEFHALYVGAITGAGRSILARRSGASGYPFIICQALYFKRRSAKRAISPRFPPQPKASFVLWQFAKSRDGSVSSWEVSLIGKRSRS